MLVSRYPCSETQVEWNLTHVDMSKIIRLNCCQNVLFVDVTFRSLPYVACPPQKFIFHLILTNDFTKSLQHSLLIEKFSPVSQITDP